MLEAGTQANNGKRFFYGLKASGRNYFTKDGKEVPSKIYIAKKDDGTAISKTDSIGFFALLNDSLTGQDYYVDIGNINGYIEIYDLENSTSDIPKNYYQANNYLGFHKVSIQSTILKCTFYTREYYFYSFEGISGPDKTDYKSVYQTLTLYKDRTDIKLSADSFL